MLHLNRNSIREVLKPALLAIFVSIVTPILASCGGKQPTETEEDQFPIPELPISAVEIVQDVFYETGPDSTWPMERAGEYGFQFKLPPGAIAPGGGTTTFDLVGSVYGLHESSLLLWESTEGDTGVVWAMTGISSLHLHFPFYYPLSSQTDPSLFVINDYIRGESYNVEYLKLRLIQRTSYTCQLLDRQIIGCVFNTKQDTSLLLALTRGSRKLVEIRQDGSIAREWPASFTGDWYHATFFNNDLLVLSWRHDGIGLYRVGPDDFEAELIADDDGFQISGIAAAEGSLFGTRYYEENHKTCHFPRACPTNSHKHAPAERVIFSRGCPTL